MKDAPDYVAALAAAGVTLALVDVILSHPELGAGARATIPPEVFIELLIRVRDAELLVEGAIAAYERQEEILRRN